MANEKKTILITGATGKQGGAVLRHLARNGNWLLRALTRDPEKPEALHAQQLGAELVQGDMEDRAALDRVMQGAYGVFSVQNFWTAGAEGEIREGKHVADAAKAAGIQHFVYTSVGGADRRTGILHFESKWEIEEYARSLGLPMTVFRPVFFMDNLSTSDYRESILNSTLPFALPPEVSLQMIAVDDIGGFVAMAFNDPQSWIGRAFEIAGDQLTIPQAAEAFSRQLGKPVHYVQMPIEQVYRTNEDYAIMLEWFVKEGYKADIPALRQLYPTLSTFDDWVRQADWLKEGQLAGQVSGAHRL